MELEEFFPGGDGPLVAELGQEISADALAEAEKARQQAEALREQMLDQAGEMHFQISQEQAERMRQMSEKLREGIKPEDLKMKEFKFDPKTMEELKQQMADVRKGLPERFKLDLRQGWMMGPRVSPMIVVPLVIPPDEQVTKRFEEMQRQEMEQLKRQMEELRALGFGDHI